MTEIVFPVVDEDEPQAEGVVATWFMDDGAAVPEGELLAEVQVAKASAEVHAPVAGTIRHKIDEDQVVRQGAVIAVIE